MSARQAGMLDQSACNGRASSRRSWGKLHQIAGAPLTKNARQTCREIGKTGTILKVVTRLVFMLFCENFS
jgi:hypothetical protein